jgi:hypothetical protein
VIPRRATQRTVAALALGLALPVLTGCGLEAMDETSKEHSQVQAADHRIGAVRIRNAYLTSFPEQVPGGQPPTTYLVVTLVNNAKTPDTFTGVTTSLGTAELSGGPVTLPPGVVVQISDPLIDSSAPTLIVNGKPPALGTTAGVTFSFSAAGTTASIPVPVVEPTQTLTPTQAVPTDQEIPATPIV